MKIVLNGSPEELIMFRNNDQKYIKGAATNVAVEKLNLYVHHSKVKIFSIFFAVVLDWSKFEFYWNNIKNNWV